MCAVHGDEHSTCRAAADIGDVSCFSLRLKKVQGLSPHMLRIEWRGARCRQASTGAQTILRLTHRVSLESNRRTGRTLVARTNANRIHDAIRRMTIR